MTPEQPAAALAADANAAGASALGKRGSGGGSRRRWWLGASVLGLLLLTVELSLWRTGKEPSHEGRTASEWFREAPRTLEALPGSPCLEAFRALEGEAVPFLVRTIEGSPSVAARLYLRLFSGLPAFLRARLPAPSLEARLPDFGARQRKLVALQLLGVIADEQRRQAESGTPSGKPSVASALEALRAVLGESDPSVQIVGAQTVARLGVAAAPLVPELIALAQSTNLPAALGAVQAFREIGPPASNACGVVWRFATNSDWRGRTVAFQALAVMGEAARPALPALTAGLTDANELVQVNAARALARLGQVPPQAVPALLRMAHAQDAWLSPWALLALWRRDPSNPGYLAQVRQSLRGPGAEAMLGRVQELGTNAAVFLPDVRALAEDAALGEAARRTVRKLEPPPP